MAKGMWTPHCTCSWICKIPFQNHGPQYGVDPSFPTLNAFWSVTVGRISHLATRSLLSLDTDIVELEVHPKGVQKA